MMSLIATTLDIVRRATEAFARDGEPAMELYTEDLIFEARGEIAGRMESHGHEGFRRALAEYAESWADMRPELRSAEPVGPDTVLTEIRWRLRAHSGVELDVDEWWLVWVRGGLICRIEQYGSRAEVEASLRGQAPR